MCKIFLILIMLVGGTAFSTAGGIKIGRFIVLYQEFTKRRLKRRLELPLWRLLLLAQFLLQPILTGALSF